MRDEKRERKVRNSVRTSSAVRSYRSSTKDTSAIALFDHLFRSGNVCVDETEEVDTNFVLDKPRDENKRCLVRMVQVTVNEGKRLTRVCIQEEA